MKYNILIQYIKCNILLYNILKKIIKLQYNYYKFLLIDYWITHNIIYIYIYVV